MLKKWTRSQGEASTLVGIEVDDGGRKHTFYIDRPLLVKRSRTFDMRLGYLDQINSPWPATKQPHEPVDTVLGSHEAFQDFIRWLYGRVLPNDTVRSRLPALWNLASSFDVPEFQNYLVDWCRKHLQTAPELLSSLQGVACSETPWPDLQGLFPPSPNEELPAYLLEKIEFEITTNGGRSFVEPAGVEWERFKHAEANSTGHDGRYMLQLLYRLEKLGKLAAKGKLSDPATAVCQWHDHDEDESESSLGTGLKNHLIDNCEQLLDPPTWLTALHGLIEREAVDGLKLSEYILEKVAFKIAKDGWGSFMAEAEDQWEYFMQSPDSLEVLKAPTLSKLMAKLQAISGVQRLIG